MRRRFPTAQRYFAAWGRHELPERAPLFPEYILYGVAQWCCQQGWRDTGALLLGFATLARPGELFGAEAGRFTLDAARGRGVWTLPG